MYHGKGAWFFITLPKKQSKQIKPLTSHRKHGWGSVRVAATIGDTTWNTSVFPDSKAGAYLLPVKAEVRKKQQIESGHSISVRIVIEA